MIVMFLKYCSFRCWGFKLCERDRRVEVVFVVFLDDKIEFEDEDILWVVLDVR